MAERAPLQRLAPPKKAAPKKAAKRAPRKAAAKKAAPPPPPPPELDEPPAPQRVEPPPPPEDPLGDAQEIFEGELLDPVYEAFKMKLAGKGWREISEATGYNHPDGARHAVHHFLMRAAVEQAADRRQAALELSLARHERLVDAWWERATIMFDPAAAAIVSRELAQIDRVQRLGEKELESMDTGRTIVIAGTPEQYVAGLQAAVLGNPEQRALPPGGDVVEG